MGFLRRNRDQDDEAAPEQAAPADVGGPMKASVLRPEPEPIPAVPSETASGLPSDRTLPHRRLPEDQDDRAQEPVVPAAPLAAPPAPPPDPTLVPPPPFADRPATATETSPYRDEPAATVAVPVAAAPPQIAVSDDQVPVRVRERSSVFAPGQLVSLLAGGALVVLGAVAVARAGLGEPLDAPVVEVLGWSHTAWLGLAELGFGAVLMLVGVTTWGRWLSVLLGAAAVVAGVIVLIEPGELPDELAVEEAMGWPLIGLGAVVAVAAMVLPVWKSTHTSVRPSDLQDDERGRQFWSRR